MEIITEPAPQDLTGVIRLTTEDYEREEAERANSLSAYLPNHQIQDTVARVSDLIASQGDAAEVRAYDAEAPIGKAAETARSIVFDLPAISQKLRVTEEQQLRARGASDAAMGDTITRYGVQVGKAIADRAELFRGEVLATGKIHVAGENGVYADVDFGRDPSMEPTTATSWADADSTPLTDLIDWAEAYSDHNGADPTQIVMSRAALLRLTRNTEIRSAATGTNDDGEANRSRVTPETVVSIFGEYGFTVGTYNRKVRVGGTSRRVLAEDRVLLLPGDNTLIGRTVFGTTVEAVEPYYGYNIAAEDAPGIVVGAFRNHDPAGVWVHGNAIAAPVMVQPDLAMSATISA